MRDIVLALELASAAKRHPITIVRAASAAPAPMTAPPSHTDSDCPTAAPPHRRLLTGPESGETNRSAKNAEENLTSW